MDAVAFYANIATLVAVAFNVIALFVTARQLWTGRRAASAGALIALNDSFRQAWLQFSQAPEEWKQHTFSDIMNLLESACAIDEDKLFVGKGGKLLEDYLCHVLILIQQSDDARHRIEQMMLTAQTFDHILKFLQRHRRQIKGIKLPTVAVAS
jgi:hypothetical protein